MSDNRRIRVFVSSTFRDMVEERNELMTQTWPELRRFCRERQVELVEVDLRWGIAEEQSTRKETLKLCLDEIRSCRPFFIGLLGERYGWVPGPDAYTADLEEEQPWLRGLAGKSVTELEILHGVLNNPEMAGRSFFYFRDPAYAQERGADFLSEDAEATCRQAALKETIRRASAEKQIPLRENYSNPRALAAFVLKDLKEAIEAQFPIEDVPDPLTREARDHEAFAETRRRTYIGRPDYFARLDRHAMGDGGPLVLIGDSGSGKSALMANWIEHWRETHPNDFVFQHYIGGTPDSADHWRLMARLIAEIKRWTNDPEEAPRSHDDLLRNFPLWLFKARVKVEHDGVRCILVLDALNQLEDRDHARLLGWLPTHPFTGGLRLIVSTLPGETMQAVEQRGWESLRVEPLTPPERYRMIARYLKRFGKKLDKHRLRRLATASPAANPLYLKILLDELRVTGIYDRLDERLNEYLAASDIPALLQQILARYQHDYERDRPGLVSESLGLIWAARRGLSEAELLHLLRPADLPQLPLATLSPLRAALEEGLVNRGGILNFAHDFLRSAVETAFVSDEDRRDELRLQLADDFEQQPITTRSCDELPWLLWKTESFVRLRSSLLNVDCFLEVQERDEGELRQYWVRLGEERTMGAPYLAAFREWSSKRKANSHRIGEVATALAYFLAATAGLYAEAEQLMQHALAIDQKTYGKEHPLVARDLNNLARLFAETDRIGPAEVLTRQALQIDVQTLGNEHSAIARDLNNLAQLVGRQGRFDEAEPIARQALKMSERCFGVDSPQIVPALGGLTTVLQETNKLREAEAVVNRSLRICEMSLGDSHPDLARCYNALGIVLRQSNRLTDAEQAFTQALAILEMSVGPNSPLIATILSNLADVFLATNRLAEAEAILDRALLIDEESLGTSHSETAVRLNNLAMVLQANGRFDEAESLYRRALAIDEQVFSGNHPSVARDLNNLGMILASTNRLDEAEPLLHRALEIREQCFEPAHPDIAQSLNNLASLYLRRSRLTEAEPLARRTAEILLNITRHTGDVHPHLQNTINQYGGLLEMMGWNREEILLTLHEMAPEFF